LRSPGTFFPFQKQHPENYITQTQTHTQTKISSYNDCSSVDSGKGTRTPTHDANVTQSCLQLKISVSKISEEQRPIELGSTQHNTTQHTQTVEKTLMSLQSKKKEIHNQLETKKTKEPTAQKNKYQQMLPVFKDGPGIGGFPKIIHLSWKNKEIPEHWQESYDNWHKFHPDWTVFLWTDDMLRELVSTKFPERLSKYDSYPHHIMRVDFARYCFLKLYGGLYCDLDICPLMAFDGLLEFYGKHMGCNVLISESAAPHGNQSLTNAFIISKRNAVFWDVVWEVLQDPYKFSPWWKSVVGSTRHYKIIFETGPGIMNESLKEYRKRYPPRAEDQFTDVQALPRNFLQHTPHWEKQKPFIKPGNMAKILQGGSWHNIDSVMATQADEAWSTRDTWAVILAAIFLAVIIILAVFLGLAHKKLNQVKKEEELPAQVQVQEQPQPQLQLQSEPVEQPLPQPVSA